MVATHLRIDSPGHLKQRNWQCKGPELGPYCDHGWNNEPCIMQLLQNWSTEEIWNTRGTESNATSKLMDKTGKNGTVQAGCTEIWHNKVRY